MQQPETLRQYLRRAASPPQAVVFDIDGVVFNQGALVNGAAEALALLREMGMPHVFLTNDGNHSPAEKAAMITAAGLDMAPENIVSCGHGLAIATEKMGLAGRLFFLLGDLGRPCYAREAGLETTRSFSELEECAGMVLGEGHYDWERGLNQAINFFRRQPGRLLLVPNPDDFYPGGGGLIEIGAGGIARFMQRIASLSGHRLEPIFLGKPHEPIFAHTHRKLCAQSGRNLPRERVLMVGDNLNSDIAGANNFGYASALVMTGVTTREMLRNSEIKPGLVLRSL